MCGCSAMASTSALQAEDLRVQVPSSAPDNADLIPAP